MTVGPISPFVDQIVLLIVLGLGAIGFVMAVWVALLLWGIVHSALGAPFGR